MKGFRKLTIENFQSHVDTEVEFSDGLNVFVGPSDSGKSAILRSLRWVLFNQPRGSEFIRTGKSKCRVTLTLSDGVEIIRERSSSTNRYILRDPTGEEQVFEGFGSQVPKEVLQAHQMHPIKLDQDWNLPVQFGTQLEGPFLLSETGGVRAKSIGRVSGAHMIDIALRDTMRDRHSLSAEVRHLEEEKKRLEEALKPFENLESLLHQVQRAEGLYQEAEEKRQQLMRLKELKEQWNLVQGEANRERSVLDRLTELESCGAILLEVERNQFRWDRIYRLTKKQKQFMQEKKHWQQILEKTAQCDTVDKQLAELEEQKRTVRTLQSIKDRRNQVGKQLFKIRQVLSSTEGLFKGFLEMDKVDTSYQHLSRLSALLPRFQACQLEKKRTKIWLSRTEKVQQAMVMLKETEQEVQQAVKLMQKNDRLRDISNRLEEGRLFLKKNEEEIRIRTEQLATLFQQMGKCPTCGSVIDGSVVKHFSEGYQEGGMMDAAAGRED